MRNFAQILEGGGGTPEMFQHVQQKYNIWFFLGSERFKFPENELCIWTAELLAGLLQSRHIDVDANFVKIRRQLAHESPVVTASIEKASSIAQEIVTVKPCNGFVITPDRCTIRTARFGQNHLFNNLWTSVGNNYCVAAAVSSNVLVENNVFDNVRDTVDTTNYSNAATIALSRNNTYANGAAMTANKGTGVFTPPYTYPLEPASAIEAEVMTGAGPH